MSVMSNEHGAMPIARYLAPRPLSGEHWQYHLIETLFRSSTSLKLHYTRSTKMSQKRKAEQLESEPHTQAPSKKKPFKPGKGHGKPKTRRPEHGDEAKTASVSELKSRIRNLRRLLEHVESEAKHRMPANVRIERERELATCQHELAEKIAAAKEAERRRNLISKYHHVRFFGEYLQFVLVASVSKLTDTDRQKATRILKKLRRQLSTETENAETSADKSKLEELQRQIHDAEVAVNYAIYYPLMKPYSALYPRTKQEKKGSDEDTEMQDAEGSKTQAAKGDPEMWAAVERAMEEGTLDALRNSDENVSSWREKIKTTVLAKGKTKDKKKADAKKASDLTKAQQTQEDGNESDGGFFE
jgi:hypothetical protein